MAHSQSSTVIAVSVVFAALTTITLTLRLWARCFLVKRIGTDDIFITAAAALSLAFIGASIRAAQLGMGSHVDEMHQRGADNLKQYLQTVWLSSVLYNGCLGMVKLSVLALYMRLGDGRLRRLAVVMSVVVAAQATANVLVCVLQCSPVRAAYDLSVTDRRCININAFYLANAACNILTDLVTYALPIPLVMKLHLSRPQRAALGVMLSLGFVACASSIIRITFIPAMLVSKDHTWDIAQPMYWSVIETNVGIMAASVPSMKVIGKVYFPKLLGTQSGSNRRDFGAAADAGSGDGCNSNSTADSSKQRPAVRHHQIWAGDDAATASDDQIVDDRFESHAESGGGQHGGAQTWPPNGHIRVQRQISMQFGVREDEPKSQGGPV